MVKYRGLFPRQMGGVAMGEALVRFPWGEKKVDLFTMRARTSGAVFHRPLWALTQQAFLEARVKAFEFDRAVFARIRYDPSPGRCGGYSGAASGWRPIGSR